MHIIQLTSDKRLIIMFVYRKKTDVRNGRQKKVQMKMKKWIALILCALVIGGSALADQQVSLPGNRYTLTLPDSMKYSPKNPSDRDESPDFQFAYYSGTLEMDVFLYDNGGVTLRGLAESMRGKGLDATVQNVNGTELLCYTDVVDSSDGVSCIGYVLMDGDQAIEIAFWYASQEAMDQSAEIMNSIQ